MCIYNAFSPCSSQLLWLGTVPVIAFLCLAHRMAVFCPKLDCTFLRVFPVHLEWVTEIVLCFCLQLFVHKLSYGERGRTWSKLALDLLYWPLLKEQGLPVQAGAAGGGWERRKHLQSEVEEEGTVSFEFWKRHVLCGFNLTIFLLWLPSSKGISSGHHNRVWVS